MCVYLTLILKVHSLNFTRIDVHKISISNIGAPWSNSNNNIDTQSMGRIKSISVYLPDPTNYVMVNINK